MAPTTTTTAFMTDHYELTALEAALGSGVAGCTATFELFARRLPKGRRYGVVAGTARALAAVEAFRFDEAELEHLRTAGVVSEATLDHLADFAFSGDVDGYAEGELYFPHSPVLTVTGPFAEAMVLETVLLSIFNHDSAVAAAAARMRVAAGGRFLIEAGGRRTHEEAAVAAARAAYIGGFDVTSNLEAGRRHGVPTAGTAMHAFTLAHRTEREAFDAQVAAFGVGTTFLVDTYDVATGIANAVAACAAVGGVPAAVRIDSGDLAAEAVAARAQLDAAGAPDTRIVVSGDLDEHRIAALAGAPIDRYLAGTQVVVGSGAPTAEMVYKLVAIADPADPTGPQHPVAKTSAGKVSIGGRKYAERILDPAGRATAETVLPGDVPPADLGGGTARPLQVPLMRAGAVVAEASVEAARERCAASLAELHPDALDLSDGPPALDATPLPATTPEPHPQPVLADQEVPT